MYVHIIFKILYGVSIYLVQLSVIWQRLYGRRIYVRVDFKLIDLPIKLM